MINETHILSSILDIPVKPESSFQVSHLEQNASERFDHFLRNRVDSHRNETSFAPSQPFEPKERPTPERVEPQTPISKSEPTPSPRIENQPENPRPIHSDNPRQSQDPLQDNKVHSDETCS